MFLEVTNLKKLYHHIPAVDDVSFQVEEGKLLTILGPSGCGKTTILRALGGFIPLNSGKILLDGTDITKLPPEDRPVSTVFQSYGLFPHMTVLENIIYGLKFSNVPKIKARELGMNMIERVHLKGQEHKKPTELSGGQQQRVAVARGLIKRPKLLLLDEPLSNLDAKLRLELREEIRAIQREFNITTVFVTHDQEEAFSIADQIMLMNEGRIVQFSNPRELYDRPESWFSLDFIGSVNYDAENSRYARLEDVIFDPSGEEMVILSKAFKGQSIEYVLETPDKKRVRLVTLNNAREYETGDRVNTLVRWTPLAVNS